MREIIFRGKRVDNGKWVHGTLNNVLDEVPKIQYVVIKHGMMFLTVFEVIPETVGQYTGLKDLHGTRIFEGDVVTHKDYAFDVYYNTEYAGFYPFYDADNGAGYGVEAKNCEIIGNVFDSPELLEGDKT